MPWIVVGLTATFFGAFVFALLQVWFQVYGMANWRSWILATYCLPGLLVTTALLRRENWARWAATGILGLLVIVSVAAGLEGMEDMPRAAALTVKAGAVLLLIGASVYLWRHEKFFIRRGWTHLAVLTMSATLVAVLGFGFVRYHQRHFHRAFLDDAHAASPVKWQAFSQALNRARTHGKYLFIDFYTTWCVPCRTMDQQTFSDPRVAELLNTSFIPVKVNAEEKKGDPPGTALAVQFSVNEYPTLLIVDSQLRVKARVVGFQRAEDLLRFARPVDNNVDVESTEER